MNRNIKLYDSHKMRETSEKIDILNSVIINTIKLLIRVAIAWIPVAFYLFFKYEGPVYKPITDLDMKLHIYVFVMFGISFFVIIFIMIMANRVKELEELFKYYKGGGA